MKDRILFITGDTLAPRTRDFLEPRGLPDLDKPFLVEELILAVHGILERNRGSIIDASTSNDASAPAISSVASARAAGETEFNAAKKP